MKAFKSEKEFSQIFQDLRKKFKIIGIDGETIKQNGKEYLQVYIHKDADKKSLPTEINGIKLKFIVLKDIPSAL
jgi:hypothetical protein